MSSILRLSILAIVYLQLAKAAPKSSNKQHSCQEFSKNVTFEDNEALGIWYLLHVRNEKLNSFGESHCVEFTNIAQEERKKSRRTHWKIHREPQVG
ncbi:unnamed protein product [Parnassius apollo]|uniref:(apollo) hypothetical protein n=1 Tax=Parnassius apollo TaxID=110799 RepID=A0A8S3XV01_PARAO|nr:unnamed protein product [Parnassius apollo]